MSITALIPARSASKGLPGKNIKPLLGRPLIAYSIEAALACPDIDTVYVSTDCPEIAKIAASFGATLLPLRPAELATDQAASAEVIRYFLDWHRDVHHTWPETLVLLQPTSPLRTATHLHEALQRYRLLPKGSSLTSVTPAKPITWQGSIAADGQLVLMEDAPQMMGNRQQAPPNFMLNGAIYCAASIKAYEDGFFKPPVYPYVMEREASVDIDTLDDFRLAELLLMKQPTCSATGSVLER